ncbi:MAG: InlB B-repeat-containing protein [Muribaculaceae bacterium]|nr:InlB B-repeat-containing protein [Muribaculaceae bacterium]MDE6522781.1 InlB B-repeat-containing protein [Muribaculaceae bacterium]
MRNKYLLLGAASALMLAACSEDIKGPESNIKPAENALNLTSLNPASQAGRVKFPGETRGVKADRLQLVSKIAPVAESEAALHHWSATGIAINNGVAIVTWHSNRQASVEADAWGGAIDVIDINALVNKSGDVITNTLTTDRVKFNNIVADGSNYYIPMTSYSNGAVVGRWNRGSLAIDTIALPGSSANSVKVDGNDLYAITGYAGGLYKVNADFNTEGVENVIETIVEQSADFGGKFIAGDYYLRTNDEKSQIVNLNGTVRNEGAPLVSSEKYAESYTPADGWQLIEGSKATHYGKHTMAVDGNYIYVGGGQGADGKNGLRVYAATGSVWENGLNTTAVCVDEKYVYAATAQGLRVYEKYDSEADALPLYAFEVLNYDENGNAADAEGMNQPQSGTDAHSANFVAVDNTSGLIFVACGQSGVYVFKLQEIVANEWPAGFTWPNGGSNVKNIVEGEGDNKFEVPAAPAAEEGKTFKGWQGDNGTTYTPGQNVTLETVVELTPIWDVNKYNVNFKDNNGNNLQSVEVEHGTNVAATKFPADPKQEGKDFAGWVIEGTETPFTSQTPVTGDVTVVPSWTDHVYAYILKFDGNKEAGITVSNLPSEVKSDNAEVAVANVKPTVPAGTYNPEFIGWSTNPNDDVVGIELGEWTPINPGDTYKFASEGTVTLYAIWATNLTGGGNQGGVVEEKPNTGAGGGAGDVKPGTMK